jgi:hypothetical protein
MLINEELKEKNYSIFIAKLKENGVETEKLEELYGDAIKNASYSNSLSEGSSFAVFGGMLHVVVRIMTPYAVKLNDVLPQELQVEKSSLVKACLLSQIAKARMFKLNDRGKFTFADDDKVSLKLSARSLMMVNCANIRLTEEEFEAILNLDKDENKCTFTPSTLSMLVKTARDFAYQQVRFETEKEKKS